MTGSMSRRLVAGLVFVGVGVINLAANGWWLRTGDIHRPNLHAVMRGGWTGFWITTILFTVLLFVGVVLLVLEWRARRHTEPARRSRAPAADLQCVGWLCARHAGRSSPSQDGDS